MNRRVLLGVVLFGLSCVPPTDDPSQVKDLRVLAINFEPPELMAANCDALLNQADAGTLNPAAFASVFQPVNMTWLIMDPAGEGRAIGWDVKACASQTDSKCENEGDFATLASGTTHAAGSTHSIELKQTLVPGFTFVNAPPDGGMGDLLFIEVISQDRFRGIGGVRMPIMLHIKAGTEEVYAMKLMVFSCRLFPEMKPNVNPVLPGMTYTTDESRTLGADDGGLWGENDLPQFSGKDGGIRFEPLPFTDLQEPYVVPTFELKPLNLVESWKVSWHTDLGRITPNQTGGVGFDGVEEKHRVFWAPLQAENTEQDVNFWMVVRDGRGGQTWIQRKLHWKP